jgi:phosphatidylserine/phosphatidylglycerophosphate/cardiolipin synthase-like enzyme
MNLSNPLLLLLIGISIGIVLTYSVLHYAAERTCPIPECRETICPEKECLDNTLVTPLSDREFYDAMRKEISNSNQSIHLILSEARYYPKSPKILVNQLFEDLSNASSRGVNVKVLMENSSENKDGYNFLKNNSVDVKIHNNKTTTHAKLAVIDGNTVIMGSTDFSYYSIEKNNEIDVIIESNKTAAYYENYFKKIWAQES